MLRKKVLPVDNFRIVRAIVSGIRHVISQFIERLHNNAESVALVVTFKVFHVFQHKQRGAASVDNSYDIKK